jgi:hypothetical protein
MLQRKDSGEEVPLETHGFLIAIECERGAKGPSIDTLINKLTDGVSFMEGVGAIEVTHMGQLEGEEPGSPYEVMRKHV